MDNEHGDNGSGAGDGEAVLAASAASSDFFGAFRVLSPGVEIFLGGRPINGMFAD